MSLSLEEKAERYLARHPDAGVPALAGALSVPPAEAAELLEAPVAPSDSSETVKPSWGSWSGAGWASPQSAKYPPEWLEREQWMMRKQGDKTPYAPWTTPDAPAPCDKHDMPTTCNECSDSARFKWGWSGNYRSGEKAEMAEIDPQIAGRVYIQREDTRYFFVDGDDVRCPESGDVHPAFIAILEHLGITYADISVSDSGVHAPYKGSFPEGVKQSSWQLDDDPWGENDDLPEIEIYPGKHVCVMTGKRVPGSAEDVRECDEEALEHLVTLNDPVARSNNQATRDGEAGASFDSGVIESHRPEATESNETTDEIKDVFKAIDMLDARRVAAETIVHRWNDDASTSGDNRAFVPTWAGAGCSGAANIVDRDKWQDTGGNGYGGPVVMALIDADRFEFEEFEDIDESNAAPKKAKGDVFWKGVQHLRDLGFEIPRYEGHNGKHKDAARVFEKAETDEEKRKRALRAMRASE